MPRCVASPDGLQAFSNSLQRIYGEPTGENPLEAVLDGLEMLMPVNSISVDVVRQGEATLTHLHGRHLEPIADIGEAVQEIAEDHPGVKHVLKHGPVPVMKLSDLATERQIRNLSLYHHVMRAHGMKDQAAVLVDVPQGPMAFAINRDKVFSGEERRLLELLQPHVQRVLGRCALFASFKENGRLTPREREVLYWMTRGKRDEEISVILRTGLRTVNDHVRHILTKLNVENRTSAVATVLGASDAPQ